MFFFYLQSHEKSVFSVSPDSVEIPPEDFVDLTITAFLDDRLKFNDQLAIHVSQGINFTISLKAAGVGTTIVSEPELTPGVFLGTFFSHGVSRNTFTLTNKGRRCQALSWTTEGFSASLLKRTEMSKRRQDPNDVRVKQRQMMDEGEKEVLKKPVFDVVPDKMMLEPLESRTIQIVGRGKE